MIPVSEILTTAPAVCKTELQAKVYEALETLNIPYQRVETGEVITMENCAAVDEKLQMEMVKTLFLANRQQTEFYLFVTEGTARFDSKAFSRALNISRVSFAPEEKMLSLLGTKIGAATVFSILLDRAASVHLVLDDRVLAHEFYGCSDGTTTGYLKLPTKELFEKLLPYAKHEMTVLHPAGDELPASSAR